jgi:hypothetical protein
VVGVYQRVPDHLRHPGEDGGDGWSPTCYLGPLKVVGIDVDAIGLCMATSGGVSTNGGTNTLLDAELAAADEAGVIFWPTIIIENEKYEGSLQCPDNIDITNCPVLLKICDAFDDGKEPTACHSSPGCELGKQRDECGMCGLTEAEGGNPGKVDVCGLCMKPDNPMFSKLCLDCEGTPHGATKVDACGVCGGPANTMAECLGEHIRKQCFADNPGRRLLSLDDPCVGGGGASDGGGGGSDGGGGGGNGGASGGSPGSPGSPAGVVIGILFALAAMSAIGYFCMKRKAATRRATRTNLGSPMLDMEDVAGQGSYIPPSDAEAYTDYTA